jgi:hypothetical protein
LGAIFETTCINDCTGNTKHFAVDNDDGIRSHRIICPLDKWLQAQ